MCNSISLFLGVACILIWITKTDLLNGLWILCIFLYLIYDIYSLYNGSNQNNYTVIEKPYKNKIYSNSDEVVRFDEYQETPIADVLVVNGSLKEKMDNFLSVKTKDIENGMYIPEYEHFQDIEGFETLTPKYFNEFRNNWFKENFKKSYLNFRSEQRTGDFFETDRELLELIESDSYPEGIIIYNLVNLLKISIQELEKRILGVNSNIFINLLKKRASFTWEGTTSSLKSFILKMKRNLKEQAIEELQQYLCNKVYNGFKTEIFPHINNFSIEFYPEGWLIIELCKINLISDTRLGKLIDYADLPYHLTKIRGFKGKRIKKIKNFINNIKSRKKKEQSQVVLTNYIKFVVFKQLNRENYKDAEEFLRFQPKKWLIYHLCHTYLKLMRDLGKDINYTDITTSVHTDYDFFENIIQRIREFEDIY